MNKVFFSMVLTVLLGLVSPGLSAAEGKQFKWPNGARAAVSLSYDDALNSQLDKALPSLNKFGLKGSFYLILASDTIRLRLDDWRLAASQGHELGNHTLFHACSGSLPDREWVEPLNDLDALSVEELRRQIILANTMLYTIDGKEERTMTVPCGDLFASGENYIVAVQDQFVAIKARVGRSGVTPNMLELNPYSVEVAVPVELNGDQLIAIAREAADAGSMANFTFHGIGGDYLSVTVKAHDQLLSYLAENSEIYWVDTFLNIMNWVADEQ